MFTCPKCLETVQEVVAKKCPHCNLPYFNEAITTWIGSSDDCNIIIKRDDIPQLAVAITYNPEHKTYELVNLDSGSEDIIVNKKVVSTKTNISIADWVKLKNIILDFNHPKVAPMFNLDVKINLLIDFEDLIEYRAGKTEECEIFIDELIKNELCALFTISSGNYFCSYPASMNGNGSDSLPIFINGFKINKGDLKLIDENDNIYIGDVKLDLSLIPDFLKGKESFYVTEKFPIEFIFEDFAKDELTLGQSNCDIVLISEKVSYKHIKIKQMSDECFWVEDCDSYYGTYIDNKKIKESPLDFHQPLIFGDFILTLFPRDGQIIIHIEHLKGKIKLDAVNVTKKVKDFRNPFSWKPITLLNNVSFSVSAGEFVALMGPSGAGKSTLLKILSGVDKVNNKSITGNVYYNNIDITKNPDHFRFSTGYLPQDDILFPDLTVEQCLLYAAKLRLPFLTTRNIMQIIDNVLVSLDLAELHENGKYTFPIKNKKIGDISKKGALSGGQRKRINLAVELMSNPSVLFLDEPTSGLSSMDSERLINLLTRITNVGSTVITTIHQPSQSIFNKFHKILILSRRGEIAYYGSVQRSVDYFERRSGLKYEANRNPATYIMEALETQSPEFWREQYLESEAHEFYVHHPHQKLSNYLSNLTGKLAKPIKDKVSDMSQFLTLVSRNFRLKYNNLFTLLLLIFQAPIIALFLGLIFSGIISDGIRFSDYKPEQEFVRLEQYSRPSTAKYLPPFSKDIKIQNLTSNKLFLYSQSESTANPDTNYYSVIGPYQISRQMIDSGEQIFFPTKSGNYKLLISERSLDRAKISESMNLSAENQTNPYYYVLNYPHRSEAINDWSVLSDTAKEKLWTEKILIDRHTKSIIDDSLFIAYQEFGKASLFAFLNPVFDHIMYFNNIKKYSYTIENQKYSWYDASFHKKVLYSGDNGYKENAQKLLYLVFIIILSFIWIGMTNSVKDIVMEKAVFVREHRYTLKIRNYVASKFASLIIISIVQIAAFLTVLFMFIPIPPADVSFIFLILLLTSVISGGIGLFISSLSDNIEFAISSLPLVLIPQIVFAGIFKHIGSMNDFLRYISSITISRWSLESLVNLISRSVDFESPFHKFIVPYNNIIYPCYFPTFDSAGKMIQSGYFPYALELDIFILFMFCIGTFIASSLILTAKMKYFRK